MNYQVVFRLGDEKPEVMPSVAINRAAKLLLKQNVGKGPYTAETEARALMLAQGAYLDLLAKAGRL